MTEDTDADQVGNQSSPGVESGSQRENSGPTREQWESLAANPDIAADLGYEIVGWERLQQLDHSDRVVFLPDDEDHLRDEAFVVADESAIVTLEEYR